MIQHEQIHNTIAMKLACWNLAILLQAVNIDLFATNTDTWMSKPPAAAVPGSSFYRPDKSRSPHPVTGPITQRPAELGAVEQFPLFNENPEKKEGPPLPITCETQYRPVHLPRVRRVLRVPSVLWVLRVLGVLRAPPLLREPRAQAQAL